MRKIIKFITPRTPTRCTKFVIKKCAMSVVIALFVACEVCSSQSEKKINAAGVDGKVLVLDVATVKPTPENAHGWQLQFTMDGFIAKGVQIRQVIQEAYGVYESDRLSAGPEWVESVRYDIEAKMTDAGVKEVRDIPLGQRRRMLQEFLAERFQLKVHHELKDLPVLELTIDKGGIKFHKSALAQEDEGEIKGMDGLVQRSGNGVLEIQKISMAGLAQILSNELGDRIVLDKTGLKDRYDISLQWIQGDAQGSAATTANEQMSLSLPDESGYPLAAALRQQLGLRLQLTKETVDTIAIDHIEKPSAN